MHYFAEFVQVGPHTFRLDTRIYLKQTKVPPKKDDRVVACVICKNPGSATGPAGAGLAPISLSGDTTLPLIKSVFEQAYHAAKKPMPEGYVQVLNLFYLCGPTLKTAIKQYQILSNPPTDPAESNVFPISWFAWGEPDPALDPMKARFLHRTHKDPIYWDHTSKSVQQKVPHPIHGIHPFAKHPQGMPHKAFVNVLSGLV